MKHSIVIEDENIVNLMKISQLHYWINFTMKLLNVDFDEALRICAIKPKPDLGMPRHVNARCIMRLVKDDEKKIQQT